MRRTYSLPRAPILFDVSGGGNGSSESTGCHSACNIDPRSRGIGVQNWPPWDRSVALPALEWSRWL